MNKDKNYMQKALELAAFGLGRTSPNPAVGAVVVKNGQVVGQGYHRKAGTFHAESIALKQAGEKSRDATMYVTLEPCNHKGKTPPCTEAIIEAGIKKVYVATLDPNSLVSGRGIKRLQEAGIEVHLGLLEQKARELNEFFFKFITQGLPFVALKTAMTLDGKIATHTGDSRWITNEKSRAYVHHLRDIYDAILVGIGTVLKDDPLLNTRLPKDDRCDPVRLVVDAELKLPLDSKIVQTACQQKTIVYTCIKANRSKIEELQAKKIEVVIIGEHPALIPLEEVMKDVAQRGLMSVLIEAGSRINAYALENKMVDKVFWFIAPKICGGAGAMSPVGGEGIQCMEEAIALKRTKIMSFDDDLLITGYLE